EYVPSSLQADATAQVRLINQAEPGFVGQGDDALLDHLYIALDQFQVTAEAELEGILEYDGQQLGRRLAAQDRAFEAGGQQIGDASDMVDMDMGRNQRMNAIEGKFDIQSVCAGLALGRDFRTLKQPAVDQQAVLRVHVQLMAGASHAISRAVMENLGVVHG